MPGIKGDAINLQHVASYNWLQRCITGGVVFPPIDIHTFCRMQSDILTIDALHTMDCARVLLIVVSFEMLLVTNYFMLYKSSDIQKFSL
jgi:hypothetical protein